MKYSSLIVSIALSHSLLFATASSQALTSQEKLAEASKTLPEFASQKLKSVITSVPKTQVNTSHLKLAKQVMIFLMEGGTLSDDSISVICSSLQFNTTKCLTSTIMQKTLSTYNLSIAHVLALVGNKKSIEWIMGQGFNGKAFQVKSFDNWTPAHFSALRDGLVYLNVFEILGGKQSENNFIKLSDKNSDGYTPTDLYDMTHLIPRSPYTIKFFSEDTQQIESLTRDEFKAVTGVEFIERMKRNSKAVFDNWFSSKFNKKIITREYDLFEIKHESILEKLSNDSFPSNKVYVKEVHYENLNLGYGLFAAQKIEKHDVITTYEGDALNLAAGEKIKNDEYSTHSIDGTDIRGYGSFGMDCTPNAVLVGADTADQRASVLISIEPIKEGDAICWDYMTHPVKYDKYIELREQEIDDFMKSGQFPISLEDFRKKVNSNLVAKLQYIASTPKVFLRLYLEDKLTIKQIEFLEKYTPSKDASTTLRLNLENLQKFSKKQAMLDSNQRDVIKSFLLEKLQKPFVMGVMFFLYTLCHSKTELPINNKEDLTIIWNDGIKLHCLQPYAEEQRFLLDYYSCGKFFNTHDEL